MWYFYINKVILYKSNRLFDIWCLEDINVLLKTKKLGKVNVDMQQQDDIYIFIKNIDND